VAGLVASGGALPTDLIPPARRAALRRRLLAWYDEHRRPLPWREPLGDAGDSGPGRSGAPGRLRAQGAPGRIDPYRVWLVEAMAQQTQVARVIPFYRRFLAHLPTLEALAAAPEEEVLALWAGLGYYARARALRRAAGEALRRHGGLPDDPEALRALPGIGPYTAGAVASIAFGRRVAAVDGNAARVLSRLFLVEGRPEAPATRARLQALAEALVPADRPGDWNQAVMELGATCCVKPVPACARCPLSAACLARRAGREREVPPARARPAKIAARLACALLVRRGRVLLVRRPPDGLFGGLWALPAVVVPAGATTGVERRLLRAELGRLIGAPVEVGAELGAVRRTLTHRELELTCLAATCPAGGPPGRSVRRAGGGALQWVGRSALERAGVASAFRALLAQSWP